ncbi:MAG: hypothetical protein LBS84_08785 [Clostridiales bacterium]|jgi:hypothetical protein|nr:hypothetical protein [Clostridiales bacterium]
MFIKKIRDRACKAAAFAAVAAMSLLYAQSVFAAEILESAPLTPITINVLQSGLEQDLQARAQIIKYQEIILPQQVGTFEIQDTYNLDGFPAQSRYTDAVNDYYQIAMDASLNMGYDDVVIQKVIAADFTPNFSDWTITSLLKLTDYSIGVRYAACVVNGTSRNIVFSPLNKAAETLPDAYGKYVENHERVLQEYIQSGVSSNKGYPPNSYYEPELGSAIINNGQLAFYLFKRTVNEGDTLSASEFVSFGEGSYAASVNFMKYPNFRLLGRQEVQLLVTYFDGTRTEAIANMTVVEYGLPDETEYSDDNTPPVFDPISNLYAQVNSDIDYYNGVSAADDSGSVEITADTSSVNPSKVGRYYVTYTATDPNGNTATAGAYISLSSASPQTVFNTADRIIASVASGNLSQYEKARRLYNWVINNVRYVDGSAHSSSIDGANTAFTRGRGDCFIFYSAVEVLFTRAGIRNVQVRRLGGATHYWNLVNTGGGWYHVDATPFAGGLPRVRFMFSESTAQYYTRNFPYTSYNYDRSLYPQAAWE